MQCMSRCLFAAVFPQEVSLIWSINSSLPSPCIYRPLSSLSLKTASGSRARTQIRVSGLDFRAWGCSALTAEVSQPFSTIFLFLSLFQGTSAPLFAGVQQEVASILCVVFSLTQTDDQSTGSATVSKAEHSFKAGGWVRYMPADKTNTTINRKGEQ